MWKLLNKYNFEIDSNLIIDLTCVICNKIVKDCRQSLCGCRYCCECIEDYLDGQDKICPGLTKDCKDQIINFSRDIQTDHVANMKVSRIVVICPESNCQHRDELRYIGDHINSHNINCPYFEVGCDKGGLSNINIDDHLKDDGFSHSKLMINSLQQLKKKIVHVGDDLQVTVKAVTNVIQSKMDNLKNNYINQTQVIENLKTDIVTLRKMCNSLKISHEEKEMLVINLSRQVATTDVETELKFGKSKTDFTSLNSEICTLKKSNQANNILVQKLVQQIDEKNSELNKLNTTISTICDELNILRKSNQEKDQSAKELSEQLKRKENETNEKYDQLKDIMENIQLNLKTENSSQQFIAPLKWTIKNFSLKRKFTEETFEDYILSEQFYSHTSGYKLCLAVWPNGSQISNWAYLRVGFCIVKGEYDERLVWPMTQTVTVSLIFQGQNNAKVFENFRYDSSPKKYKGCFHRPNALMNKPRSNAQFINLNALINDAKLYKNDSIILRCSID